jgi:hypothetical protein
MCAARPQVGAISRLRWQLSQYRLLDALWAQVQQQAEEERPDSAPAPLSLQEKERMVEVRGLWGCWGAALRGGYAAGGVQSGCWGGCLAAWLPACLPGTCTRTCTRTRTRTRTRTCTRAAGEGRAAGAMRDIHHRPVLSDALLIPVFMHHSDPPPPSPSSPRPPISTAPRIPTPQHTAHRTPTRQHTNTHQHTPTHTSTHQHTPTHTSTHQHQHRATPHTPPRRC